MRAPRQRRRLRRVRQHTSACVKDALAVDAAAADASAKAPASVGARELLVEEHFSCCCMRTFKVIVYEALSYLLCIDPVSSEPSGEKKLLLAKKRSCRTPLWCLGVRGGRFSAIAWVSSDTGDSSALLVPRCPRIHLCCEVCVRRRSQAVDTSYSLKAEICICSCW